MSILAFLLSLLPIPPLLIYFGRHDRATLASELFWTAAGFGFLVAIPVAIIEAILLRLFGASESLDGFAAITAFPIAALPEELAKYVILVGFVLGHADFDRPRSAFLLGLAVSLGFATIENVAYVAQASNWTTVALLRAITAVPMHATAGVVMGVFAARASAYPEEASRSYLLAFLIPAMLHGAYDFAVITVSGFKRVSGAPTFPLWVYVTFLSFVFIAIGLTAAAAPQLAPAERRAKKFPQSSMRN